MGILCPVLGQSWTGIWLGKSYVVLPILPSVTQKSPWNFVEKKPLIPNIHDSYYPLISYGGGLFRYKRQSWRNIFPQFPSYGEFIHSYGRATGPLELSGKYANVIIHGVISCYNGRQ